MRKALLLWLSVVIGLLTGTYGCGSMAKQMSAGETLYRSKCSSCHNVISPARHDKEQWQFYVDKYGENMTGGEKQRVLDYLANPE